MSQFESTGEQIAQEIALEGYGAPEKARMRAALIELAIVNDRLEELTAANERKDKALEAILEVTSGEFSQVLSFNQMTALYIALSKIDQLTRQGLAP